MKHERVTVIDFETTGLDVRYGDRIIEVGAIKVSGNSITGIFETLVNPERGIPAEASKINGISEEMVQNAPLAAQVIPELVSFIGDDVLVMHNAQFDATFLEYHLRVLGSDKKFEYYCTYKNARAKLKGVPNFRLSTLKNVFGLVPFGTMHRALSDAFVTLQLYLKLEGLWAMDSKDRLQKQLKQLSEAKQQADLFRLDSQN